MGVALNPGTKVLIRHKKEGETRTQQRSRVETEAETGGRRPPAQGDGRLELQKRKRREDPPLEPRDRAQPWTLRAQASGPQGWGRTDASDLKSLVCDPWSRGLHALSQTESKPESDALLGVGAPGPGKRKS